MFVMPTLFFLLRLVTYLGSLTTKARLPLNSIQSNSKHVKFHVKPMLPSHSLLTCSPMVTFILMTLCKSDVKRSGTAIHFSTSAKS